MVRLEPMLQEWKMPPSTALPCVYENNTEQIGAIGFEVRKWLCRLPVPSLHFWEMDSKEMGHVS